MPTHVRYLTGLLFAFLMAGAVIAATIVPATFASGRQPRLFNIIDIWAFFGTLIVISLAAAVGPVVLLMRWWLGARFTARWAALIGAASGPLMLIAAWLLVRESNETFGQLLAFWWRLPLELILGVLPYMAAGALFAWWLTKPQGRLARS